MSTGLNSGRADLHHPAGRRDADRPEQLLSREDPAAVDVDVADDVLTEIIADVHETNFSVYGARKMHAKLRRRGHPVARCTVHG